MGLRLDDISHAYDRAPVVRDVSLAVGPGEVACLLGPSGCGKTTLLRLAAGLEVLQHGRISIAGRTVADAALPTHVPPERRRAGLMFQDHALFPHLNVLANVTFGIAKHSRGRMAWAREALQRLGLGAHVESYPHTLSGGEQQRCALLRALAPEPDVLLLDEPFSGMDVTRRAQVREETLSILRETGIATLIVTHDPEEAMFMADRLWIMNAGSIVQHGTPEEIYLHPRTVFVAALFGPLNRIEGRVRRGRLETAFGAFPAPGRGDSVVASAFVRPEAVLVHSHNDASRRIPVEADGATTADWSGSRLLMGDGHVLSARLLGRASHLRVVVPELSEPVEALVPGVFLPQPGEKVAVALDPDRAFVFPEDAAEPA